MRWVHALTSGDPQVNFDFSEDQKLLQQTAKDYLAEHSPLTVCREVFESDIPYSIQMSPPNRRQW